MQPFQERVVEEKRALDEKIKKLDEFGVSSFFKTLPVDEQKRLGNQFVAMTEYSKILGERIAAFGA